MKLTTSVKFGDEIDNKERLGTKLTADIKFRDEMNTFT